VVVVVVVVVFNSVKLFQFFIFPRIETKSRQPITDSARIQKSIDTREKQSF
jgi:hypothetical protein